MALQRCDVCQKLTNNYTVTFNTSGAKVYFCQSCYSARGKFPSSIYSFNMNSCAKCSDPQTSPIPGTGGTLFLCTHHEALFFGHKTIPPLRSQCQICGSWKDQVHMHTPNSCNGCVRSQYNRPFNMNPNYPWSSSFQSVTSPFGNKRTWTGVDLTSNKTIEFSNGDTEEWTRLDTGYSNIEKEREIIKGLLNGILDSSCRIFDFKRKCWFVRSDIVPALKKGFETLINQGNLKYWSIKDSRVTVETFEDFFEAGEAVKIDSRSQSIVVTEFWHFCTDVAGIGGSLNECDNLIGAKALYRKAALKVHPDRNNGDSTRMTELNLIWAELQTYFK